MAAPRSPTVPEFVGEKKGGGQPVALTSKTITRLIKPGTVAAVECCYGAQLYNSVTLAKPIPICQHYLLQGAYGFFGSTTIAYGPEDTNGSADLITQYFLTSVLDGASLGRAALVARQRFIQQTAELDVFDLKTLAQFHLLGDPSIHPVKADIPAGVPKGISKEDASRVGRRERRLKLKAMGEFLRDHKPTASRKAKGAPKSAAIRKALNNIAARAGIRRRTFSAYDVATPPAARKGKTGALASRYYVSVYKPRDRNRRVAAVAKQVGGRIVAFRIYLEK